MTFVANFQAGVVVRKITFSVAPDIVWRITVYVTVTQTARMPVMRLIVAVVSFFVYVYDVS